MLQKYIIDCHHHLSTNYTYFISQKTSTASSLTVSHKTFYWSESSRFQVPNPQGIVTIVACTLILPLEDKRYPSIVNIGLAG